MLTVPSAANQDKASRPAEGARIWILLFTAAVALGCVSTPFKGTPAANLSDNQLVMELSNVYQQLGLSTSSLYQLRQLMPAPRLVITAESFTTFWMNTQVIGDTAYSTGTATTSTRYTASDQNELARSMNQLAQNIQLARLNELNGRRIELEYEANGRIQTRHRQAAEIQAAISRFFDLHPSLRAETALLAQITPFEQATSYQESLSRIGFEAEAVLAGRSTGSWLGRWYGSLQIRIEDSTSHGLFPKESSSPDLYAVRGDIRELATETSIELETAGRTKVAVNGSVGPEGLSFSGRLVISKTRDSSNFEPDELLTSDVTGSLTSSQIRLTFIKTDPASPDQQLRGVLALSR